MKNTKQVGIWLPERVLQKLDKLAEKKLSTRSQEIRNALFFYLTTQSGGAIKMSISKNQKPQNSGEVI